MISWRKSVEEIVMEFAETPFRPPQEAQSLLLRATQGCTYNACNFCYSSRGYVFMAATQERLEQELLEKKGTYPADSAVYLIGANPMALPMKTLCSYLAVLRRHAPDFAELRMQSMVRDVKGKSAADLRELRRLGLRLLYIGTESGSNEALELMNKGHTAEEAVEQLLRLDEAGIGYSTQYVLGLAGKGQGRHSAEATAAFFNQVHPHRITTTGLTVFSGTPLETMVRTGRFVEAPEKEKVEELLLFLERLSTDTYFDSVHYLNPLTYRFQTGTEKAGVLEDIRDILATYSDEEMELMVNRKLMRSL